MLGDKNTGKIKTEKNGAGKSIRTKMLFRIITPLFVLLVLTALLISYQVRSTISRGKAEEIRGGSTTVAYQVSEYFTKYMETARQTASNNELIRLFEEVKPGDRIAEADLYDTVIKTMSNIHQTDPDNILVSWVADADSSQCIEDTGYISEIGKWDITTRDWYADVVKAGTTIVTEPYENSSTGEMVSSVITPVYDETGELLGVASLDLAVGTVSAMMEEHRLGDTGFFMLVTESGSIMYAPDEAYLYRPFTDLSIDDEVKNAFSGRQFGTCTYSLGGEKMYGYMEQAGDSRWVVLSGMPDREYNAQYYNVIKIIAAVFVFVLLLLCLIIVLTANGITKPLRTLDQAANEIAAGNLDIALSVESKDEIGQVAFALGKTVKRLKDYIVYINEITSILNEIADGNLAFRLEQDYAGEFGRIRTALENIATRLNSTMDHIKSTAIRVSSGSEQIANGAQSLASGADSQSAAVEKLAEALNEITDQVKENAELAKAACKRTEDVKGEIEFGNRQMEEAVHAMERINECSDQIQNIITSIEVIAEQTNLLSLNASIEAARAGEMGRGFAVVAGEVGNLSRESVDAVQTSTKLIQDSMEAVQDGMEIVRTAAEKLSASVNSVSGLAEVISGIADASGNQLSSIEQIRDGVNRITDVVTDNSAMAEESAASSEELSAQSQTLNELMQTFRLKEQ